MTLRQWEPFLEGLVWGLPWVPRPKCLCACHPKCLTPERKMEVEQLSPLVRSPFSLTPTKSIGEEDDGFVDILESDLKVSSFAPSDPCCFLSGIFPKEKALSSCSQTVTLDSNFRGVEGN